MTTAALLWTCLAALAATAVASLGCQTLREIPHHDLEEVSRRSSRKMRYGEILRQHEQVALGVEIISTICGTLVIVTGLLWAEDRWAFATGDSWLTLTATVLGLSLLLAVFLAWIPWTVSRLFAAPFLFHTWPIWKMLAVVTFPLVLCARGVDTMLHRLVGRTPQGVDEESLEEEIRAIVSEGHREGLLEEDAREMIEGVIELGGDDVSEIMTPRTDMHMVQADSPWDEVITDVIESGHTRIPVYNTNRDDVVGVLYSKDLLPELAKGDPQQRAPLRELLRPAVFVPVTKALDDLLQMFQITRNHLAVVLDEYGGVAGLVTIEDVLEEIVGEIVDEYDEELAAEIERLDENTCEALGRTHVDEINEVMHLELPDDGDFDTIGGFVFTELGRIPNPGEKLVWEDKVHILVIEASKRRIERVRIERLDGNHRESA